MLLSALLDMRDEIHKTILSQSSGRLFYRKRERDQGTYVNDVIQLVGRGVTRILICVTSFTNGSQTQGNIRKGQWLVMGNR